MFQYQNKEDFYEKLSTSKIVYPFLVRVNNSVSGKGSVLVRNESQLESALDSVEQDNKNRKTTDKRQKQQGERQETKKATRQKQKTKRHQIIILKG